MALPLTRTGGGRRRGSLLASCPAQKKPSPSIFYRGNHPYRLPKKRIITQRCSEEVPFLGWPFASVFCPRGPLFGPSAKEL